MSRRLRRTKIVTTLGPATDRDNNLEKVIAAGANVVRMNFSHGTPEDHQLRADKVREIAAKLGRHVAILGDLQGPKIRVSTFKEGKVFLNIGDKFLLDANLGKGEGDKEKVGIDYKGLPADVVPGDILLLDDGRVQLKVLEVQGMKVFTEVTVGGPLSNNKGINKLGGGLSAEALTDKDKADIVTAAKIGVDYLAVSFPRCGEDLNYARRLARDAGCDAKIVAKVERAEAVCDQDAMDDVILASDVVMVARGDLGVEIGDPELVGIQKALIRRARQLKSLGHHRHADDGINDYQSDADPRGSHGRGERRTGRYRCRDALRGNRCRRSTRLKPSPRWRGCAWAQRRSQVSTFPNTVLTSSSTMSKKRLPCRRCMRPTT